MPTNVANLPADIVCELFMQAASTDPPRYLDDYIRRRRPVQKRTLGWIYLTHICHGWRLIGLDLAPLWASLVTFFPSPSIADELLSRSRDCDLQLDLQSIGSGDLIHMEAWVSQHLDRASQLTVVGKANRDVFREKQLSRLRTLIIRYGRQTPGIEIDAPGLRDIHLSECTVSFRSTMPQLTALELSYVYFTAAELLDTFRCVPFLERLRIFHGTGCWSGAFPHTIIELHHLAMFNMHTPSTEAFLDLWEHLSVPPSVTVKLVTNDVPDVSILLSGLHSQLGWSSYDSLIIYSSGFSLTCGEPDAGDDDDEHVAGLKWLFASGNDLGLNALDLLEQLQLHLAVANIHHCELELPSVLKELDCAKGEPVALRLDVALRALGVALKNTTALALQGFEPDPALLRALAPRGSSTPFPHLRSLLLGKHQSSWVAKTRSGPGPKVIKTDWELVEATLTARKQGGAPVQRLVLAGQWCIREQETQSWTSQWSRHSVRCRDMNLVMEVEDERVFETICDTCNMPELETVSDELEEELGFDEWGFESFDEGPDLSEDEE